MKVKVSRIEWVPTRYEYEIDVPNDDIETIVAKMESLDEGELPPEEGNLIVESRTVIKRNDDFEAIIEVDDVDYWQINGKDIIEIEEELDED